MSALEAPSSRTSHTFPSHRADSAQSHPPLFKSASQTASASIMSSSSSLSHLSDAVSSQSIAAITDFSPSSPSSRSSNESLLSSPPLSPSLSSRHKNDAATPASTAPLHSKLTHSTNGDDANTVTLIVHGSAVTARRDVLIAQSALFRSLFAADDADAMSYHLPARLPATAEQVVTFIELMTDITALTTPTYRSLHTETILRLAAHLGCAHVTAAIDALLTKQYRNVSTRELQTHCDALMLAHTFALTQLAITIHTALLRIDGAFVETKEFATVESALNPRLFQQCDNAIRNANLSRRVRPGGSIM